MATTHAIEVDVPSNEVRITELVVHDDELVEFLEGVDDDRVEEAVVRALKVGAATLNLAETEKELEYVRRHFQAMNEEFESEIDRVQSDIEEQFGDDGRLPRLLDDYLGEDGSLRTQLERAFGEDGIFSHRLDQELGENGERIQEALDPDREGTPTYRLKQAFRDEINDLEELLLKEEGREEVRARTTLKGEDFEEDVATILDDLVYNTAHSYDYTGNTEGELTGRDVGDFVIDLGDIDQRIVVEAKSDKSYTEPKIKEEMADAMENRLADYGIFVSQCESYVPRKLGYFHEIDRAIVVVCLSEDEDDELDPRLFRMAFNWAKIRATQAAVDTGGDVDAEAIQSKVEAVRKSIDRFQQIRSKTTNIRDSAIGIDEQLTEIANDVTEHLNDIRTELSTSAS